MANDSPVLICFVATKEWWAPAMRWLLRCEYNHSFVLFLDPMWKEWQTIDITRDGVQILPWYKSFGRVKEIECWKYKRSLLHGLQDSNNLIGAKYDWLGLAINVLRLFIWRLFGRRWRTPLHDVTRYMCFEFVVSLLQLAGISSALQLEPSLTPPDELRKFLQNNEGFEVVSCPMEVA